MFRFIALAALLALASAFQPRLDNYIVGGEDASIQDFPYQLSLQAFRSHMCGASIISNKWAVTAAHCTDGQSASYLSLVAGIGNLNEGGQRIKIKKIHQHPDFNMSHLNKDMSVLELASEINLSSKAQPVALAADGSDLSSGTNVVVSGWGALWSGGGTPDQLQKVTVQVVGRDACKKAYGNQITEYMVCAGVPQGGKDACKGDSGGPLVANGQLVGIVSWGYGCPEPGYPGVYARVGALRSFIKEKSGI